ncbi:MAG: hypothetical protein HY819_24840 [Acidobacteria bacterium]|nr:hypothetical protein [Acidobacteriota bacterium]
MKKLLIIPGILITLFSSFFVFAAIGDLITGDKQGTGTGVLLGLLVFFLGTAFSGILLARYGLGKKKSNLSEFDQEQRVLALAKTTGGKLTVADVALHCRLTIDESKDILDKIAAQGVAEMQFTNDGNFFYLFPSFLINSEANQPLRQIPLNSTSYQHRERERE